MFGNWNPSISIRSSSASETNMNRMMHTPCISVLMARRDSFHLINRNRFWSLLVVALTQFAIIFVNFSHSRFIFDSYFSGSPLEHVIVVGITVSILTKKCRKICARIIIIIITIIFCIINMEMEYKFSDRKLVSFSILLLHFYIPIGQVTSWHNVVLEAPTISATTTTTTTIDSVHEYKNDDVISKIRTLEIHNNHDQAVLSLISCRLHLSLGLHLKVTVNKCIIHKWCIAILMNVVGIKELKSMTSNSLSAI